MVPKKSHFSPKVSNFAFVELFSGRSQIPNPVLERLDNSFLDILLNILLDFLASSLCCVRSVDVFAFGLLLFLAMSLYFLLFCRFRQFLFFSLNYSLP